MTGHKVPKHADAGRSTKASRHLWGVGLFVLATAGLAWALRDHLSFAALSENRADLLAFTEAHRTLSVVLFIATYTVIVALSLPGATIATLTGGFLFGLFPGGLYNVIGATCGASLLFLAARWGLGDWLAARLDASEGRIHKIKQGLDENQWSMLFLMRLLPIVPFFVANLIPALLGVAFGRFVVSTAIGILPGALIYTSVGAGLGAVFEEGTAPDLGVIFEPYVLLPILGLCLLALIPVFWKRRRASSL